MTQLKGTLLKPCSLFVSLQVKVEAEEGGEAVAHVLSRRGLGCGLLLDWLSELQRETLGRQMKLMFEKGGGAWRPLLVTLLAHRASWRTLHAVLAALTAHGYALRGHSGHLRIQHIIPLQ